MDHLTAAQCTSSRYLITWPLNDIDRNFTKSMESASVCSKLPPRQPIPVWFVQLTSYQCIRPIILIRDILESEEASSELRLYVGP